MTGHEHLYTLSSRSVADDGTVTLTFKCSCGDSYEVSSGPNPRNA